MKRKMISSICLAALLFALIVPVNATNDNPNVKIGLAYGNNALPGAKLLNYAGQDIGYSFGYFDKNYDFNEIGYIDYRYLVILKDKTVYMSTSEVFSDDKPSALKKAIYPYHLQVDYEYYDFDEATFEAKHISNMGYNAFAAYVNGVYVIRIGEYPTLNDAKGEMNSISNDIGYGLTAVGGSTTCYTVAQGDTGVIVFEFDMKGQAFGVMPYSEATWFSGYSYRGGFEYNRVNGNDVTVINVVDIQNYNKGVISNEMNPTWNIEALKAQALCAKSYCMTNLKKHSSLGFDLCNTTDCQVYYGTRQETANSNRAVDETYGMFIKYKGKIVSTVYHSSSGGHTEDAVNVWGNSVGYLKGVEDKHLVQTLPYSFNITNSQIKTVLQEKGYNVSTITDYYVSEYTPSGNVRSITFVQSSGAPLVFTGEKARTIINNSGLGFKTSSQRYTVSPTIGGLYINTKSFSGALSSLFAIGGSATKQMALNADKTRVMTADGISKLEMSNTSYTVSGTGSGHNVGMSQWGAKAMADKGFDYEEILHFYFTDIEIGYLN